MMKKKFIRLLAILTITAAIIYTLPLIFCGLVLDSSEVSPEDVFLKTVSHKKASYLLRMMTIGMAVLEQLKKCANQDGMSTHIVFIRNR